MARAGATTARGYGYHHRKARTAALQAMRDGDPCPRCNHPMWIGQALDLDHTNDRTGYLGLAHRSCNRSAGATHGNRLRTHHHPPSTGGWHSRTW